MNVNFTLNFVGKLGSCEVRAIRCSWFDNITTQMNLNKVKKKILNQAMLIYDMYTKLFEKYRRTPHHRRMARLAFCLQYSKVNTKVQQYDVKMFCFFHAIPRRMYVLKKGVSSLIDLNVKYF